MEYFIKWRYNKMEFQVSGIPILAIEEKGVHSMITYVKGDLFSSPARILVNTVNTEGVMGKGIALEFKKRYPEMFQEYKKICNDKTFGIGSLLLWKKSEKWVLLFPTKTTWRRPSKMEYIEKGLQKFANNWDKLGAGSVAFPRLGCGNGGLDWEEVRPLMEKYLARLPIQIYVYVDTYQDPVSEHENITEIERWLAGEEELDGYAKFAHRVKNYLNTSEKVLGGKKVSMRDGENAFLRIDDMDVSQDTLCDLWCLVRDAGVLSMRDIWEENRNIAETFMELMRALGYVAKVIISDDGKTFGDVPNGYQYIAD